MLIHEYKGVITKPVTTSDTVRTSTGIAMAYPDGITPSLGPLVQAANDIAPGSWVSAHAAHQNLLHQSVDVGPFKGHLVTVEG